MQVVAVAQGACDGTGARSRRHRDACCLAHPSAAGLLSMNRGRNNASSTEIGPPMPLVRVKKCSTRALVLPTSRSMDTSIECAQVELPEALAAEFVTYCLSRAAAATSPQERRLWENGVETFKVKAGHG